MANKLYTEKEMLAIIDNILEDPDNVIDYLTNENTNHSSFDFLQKSLKELGYEK